MAMDVIRRCESQSRGEDTKPHTEGDMPEFLKLRERR